MALEPDVIAGELAELAAETPPPRFTTASVAARVRKRRRRRRAVLAGTAGALSLATGLVLLLPSTTPAPTPTSGPAALAPDQQAVSYHGVEVIVPRSWRLNDLGCGTPLRDTVITWTGATPLCAMAQKPNVTFVRLGSYNGYVRQEARTAASRPHSGRGALATLKPPRTLTVLGRAATLREIPASDPRRHAYALLLPDLDVAVTAESPDASYARRLVQSLRLARPTDANGCADPLDGAAPVTMPPGTLGTLAPDPSQITAASVCGYVNRRVVGSMALTDRYPGALADRLNALRPAPERSPSANCPALEDSTAYVVRFQSRQGRVDVLIRLAGCRPLAAYNGASNADTTPDLYQYLSRLTHGMLDGGPPDETYP